ncbi:MAG: hypothetical protein U0790_16580 [Isosphaeraceae bacterium]
MSDLSAGHDALSARIERLEASNRSLTVAVRRFRLGGLVGAATLAILFLTGAVTIPQTLEARNFILRDESGKMRAALAIRPDGTPGLALYEKDGRVRLSLDLGTDGPAVNLMDGIGKPQAALAMRKDGTPGLGLFDSSGQVRVSLDIHRGGLPAVNLYGDQGLLRAALAVRPDNSPGLGLFGADGDFGASFEIPGAGPSLRRRQDEGVH